MEMDDTHVGLQARLMSQAMRKLSGAISKTKTTCIFINQIREKVGIIFGNPETTPGDGSEVLFFSKVGNQADPDDKDGDESVGAHTTVKAVNKVALP